MIIIRKANLSDIEDLFCWRNHPSVRKNSFNNSKILWEEHVEWFSSSLIDFNRLICIAERGDEKIGMVRFDYHDEFKVYISIYLNPDFIGKGFGSEVLDLALNFFRKNNQWNCEKILAKVLVDNIASIKIFEKAGFEKNYILFEYQL